MLWCKPLWFKFLIIGAENVTGAEDHLEKALKVLHGGENLTNIEVVEAIKMIQQRTKRKGSNQDVFKFQDVTIE